MGKKRHSRYVYQGDDVSRGSWGQKAAEAAVTIAVTATGMYAQPPTKDVFESVDAYEQSRQDVADKDRRSDYLDEQTGSANDRKGYSGQS